MVTRASAIAISDTKVSNYFNSIEMPQTTGDTSDVCPMVSHTHTRSKELRSTLNTSAIFYRSNYINGNFVLAPKVASLELNGCFQSCSPRSLRLYN